jgi:hypothetical protein
MMSFGWRPPTSCYKTAAQDQAQQTAAACPSVTWFYVALALAVIAGAKK